MNYDAVLLVAFGGPERMEEVRPFLDNVLRDRRVLPERVEMVVEQYRQIGGRSPLNERTKMQAEKLRANLEARAIHLPVYVAMKNWHPYIADVLQQIVADGHKKIWTFILAPHVSEASWGRYQESIRDAQKTLPSNLEISYAPPWHKHPLFIEAIVSRIQQKSAEIHPDADWIFTAHSIPISLDQTSGYSRQILATVEKIVEKLVEKSIDKLGCKNVHISYQSRSGRPEDSWLEPDICDVIRELKLKNSPQICVVPVGFLCDHAEVLYDLDLKAAAVAKTVGIPFLRFQTVEDHPAFIEMLSEIVQSRV